jgi:hypothetical protein
MLIDIPVFIAFDTDNPRHAMSDRSVTRFSQTITLRFDPENNELTGQYCNVYPPRKPFGFYPDKDNVILGQLSDRDNAKILALALADPESYYVDQDAAKERQAELEQERDR